MGVVTSTMIFFILLDIVAMKNVITMRKSGYRMLAFEGQLLAVGGVGVSLPKDPSPSATYEKLDEYIYITEHHIYDREGG